MTKLSIIIPTHNRKELLKRALESVINQTFKDWEAYVICDNCKDGTEEFLGSFLASDPKFTVITVEKSVGGAEARNIGIGYSNGEYIAFLDDDDEWMPDKLQLQVDFLNMNEDVSIVSCAYLLNETDAVTEIYNLEKLTIGKMLYMNLLGSFSFCMIRNSDRGANLIRSDLRAFQDWYLWLRIMIDSRKRAYIIPECLVRYDCSHSNERISSNSLNRLDAYRKLMNQFWKYMTSSHKNYHEAVFLSRSMDFRQSTSKTQLLRIFNCLLKTRLKLGIVEFTRILLHPVVKSGNPLLIKVYLLLKHR